MSPNKKIVEAYLSRRATSELSRLVADDVEWVEWADGVPASGVRTRGKAAFIRNFGDDELRTQIARMTEEGDVVVAEGVTRVLKKDGRVFTVQFCDIFDLEDGKVKRLTTYAALLKDPA
ncbi:MAG TPA: nuclear transport factor 2 family protein [Thermoplasmata archaeon]|nr:nuclear transport factor 2 family protein [Thermoplasmata archaeon]